MNYQIASASSSYSSNIRRKKQKNYFLFHVEIIQIQKSVYYKEIKI